MKTRVLAGVMSVVAVFALAPTTAAATPTLRQRLANVVVPAYCDMPQQRLHNGKTASRFLPAQGAIVFGKASSGGAMRVHLRPVGTQVLAQYGCNAGNVSWPAVIVLYDRRNRLIGDIKLGNISHTEHADVTHWSVAGHTVKVSWVSYEGCCFHVHHHNQTLTLSGGRLNLT